VVRTLPQPPAPLTYRAHDLEKRQHLFGHGILQPLPPSRVGLFGSGSPADITPEVVKAEKGIEAQWSSRPAFQPVDHVYDPEVPEPDYPDQPPAYSASVAPGATNVTKRVPPPLPPRDIKDAKLPGAFN
jgi:hypothetical protein